MPPGIFIPVYWSADVSAIVAQKQAHPNVPILCILNPNSGPGASQDPSYTAAIAALHAVGAQAVGYVDLGAGSHRTQAAIEADVTKYMTWYPGIDGIFFDDMLNGWTALPAWFSTLNAFAKSKGAALTMGNPGDNPGATYMGLFDVLCVYENAGYPAPAALSGFPSSQQIAFIATGVTFNPALVSSLSPLAQWLYVTDDPATYQVLPTYFAQEDALLDTGAPPTPVPTLLAQVGLCVNYPEPATFIQGLAAGGLKWVRQYGPNQNTLDLHAAGISTLMCLNANVLLYLNLPYTDVRQVTPQAWAGYVTQLAQAFPWITSWEFMNEPNLAGGSTGATPWSQQQYLQYLAATYQALKAVNPANTLIGPTLAWPGPLDPYDITNGPVAWLSALWALVDPATGLKASDCLSAVSMHIYTCCWGGGLMVSDPYAAGLTETEGQIIQAGLAQCYAVTGKPMVIDEWGWGSSPITEGGATTPSTPAQQATYYSQFMALMKATPNIQGVFAFHWADYSATDNFGVFDSSLNAKPAWATYQSFFPSPPPAPPQTFSIPAGSTKGTIAFS